MLLEASMIKIYSSVLWTHFKLSMYLFWKSNVVFSELCPWHFYKLLHHTSSHVSLLFPPSFVSVVSFLVCICLILSLFSTTSHHSPPLTFFSCLLQWDIEWIIHATKHIYVDASMRHLSVFNNSDSNISGEHEKLEIFQHLFLLFCFFYKCNI